MKTPEQIVPGANGRMVYQARVVEKGKTYLVRLIVEEWHQPPIIVTLYRTSRLEKYWRNV